MSIAHIIDLSGAALDALLRALSGSANEAAAAARRLDEAPVAAISLGLQDDPSKARDRTVAAAFILARTRRTRVLATVDPARQHPIHVARTVSTLHALHRGRIGLIAHADAAVDGWYRHPDDPAAHAADYLRLLSGLWDSWPLDAVARDSGATRYVDAARLLRLRHPRFPGIGGPLTLPTDGLDKPPLLLAHPGAASPHAAHAVDLHLVRRKGSEGFESADGRCLLRLGEALEGGWLDAGEPGDPGAPTLRRILGLAASGPAGVEGTAVFANPDNARRI